MSIFQSPLMMGGCLTDLDSFTLGLLTNDEVLAVNQRGNDGRQLLRAGDFIVWTARSAEGECRYIALFNVGDAGMKVRFEPAKHGLSGTKARDLWAQCEVVLKDGVIERELAPHGCALLRLSA